MAEKLGERLGRTVAIDDLSINPFTLAAEVKGLRILEPDARTAFVPFDSLDLDADASSLYRLAPVVDELTLSGLKVNVQPAFFARVNGAPLSHRSRHSARALAASMREPTRLRRLASFHVRPVSHHR